MPAEILRSPVIAPFRFSAILRFFREFRDTIGRLHDNSFQTIIETRDGHLSQQFDEPAVSRGLREGDRAAWTALYDEYSVRVWRYAARIIGQDASAVADVVQETFLAAARSAAGYDPKRGTLWSWLCGIAHHKSAYYWKQLRQEQRLKSLAESNGHLTGWWNEAEGDPAKLIQTKETGELVRAALAGLTAEYAALLTARHLEGQSIAEIQEIHGGTPDAVRSKLSRARTEFRAAFERLTADPREASVSSPAAADRTGDPSREQ